MGLAGVECARNIGECDGRIARQIGAGAVNKSNWARFRIEGDGYPFLEDIGGDWYGKEENRDWVWSCPDDDFAPLYQEEEAVIRAIKIATEDSRRVFEVMVYGVSYQAERYESIDYGVEYDGWMEWEHVQVRELQPIRSWLERNWSAVLVNVTAGLRERMGRER